jgi:hypothetical protein
MKVSDSVRGILSSLNPPGAKKISAKCSAAMVSWGANCSSPRLLNITCGDLLPSPLPLSPTGRGKGEGDLWRYFLQRLGKPDGLVKSPSVLLGAGLHSTHALLDKNPRLGLSP